MHKRMFRVIALLVLLFAYPLQAAARSFGASSAPLENHPIQIGENQAVVSFADLGFRGADLVSPYDSTRVLFSIPSNWKLIPGGLVEIDYDILLSGGDASKITDDRNPYGGALTVTFNDYVIGTIPMDQLGNGSVEFPLPAEALTPVRQDGRHQLAILLNAQFSCVYDIRALVSIRNTSLFKLQFEASSPQPDLSKLPGPFFLRNSLLPDSTLVVVPDQPSEVEMQSALNVMAGFGSMISDESQIEIVNAGSLTAENRTQSHLIFVGKPEAFEMLSEIELPVTVASGQFTGVPEDAASDGILQMAVSPWNNSKAVMVVSGADDAAVAMAAQAVSSGQVFIFEDPALAYVSGVQTLAPVIPVVEDFTLESLGYTTQTLSGVGLNNVEYLFNVAKEQVSGKGGSVDLAYYHSGLLDYGVSSLSVTLNDQIIGSAVFNKDSEKLTSLRINVPPGILRYGENRLSVSTSLLAESSCDTSGFSDPWLVISDQSGFHLPPGTPDAPASNRTLDLKFFPGLFMSRSDLGDLAFILPQSHLPSWRVAGQLAYELGWEANPLISNLHVAFADNVSAEIRDTSSMILIGKASDLPFLAEFNANLPAPFDLEANTASERDMQIVYRVPAGVSVGYLELMHSPYNLEKLILVASGNDDIGLAMAGSTLRQGPLQSRLAGQFAVTNGVQVATGSIASSQFSVAGTAVPDAEQVVATPIPDVKANQPGFERPSWLNILPVSSAVVILLILAYVFIVAMLRRREPTPAKNRTEKPAQSNGDRDHK